MPEPLALTCLGKIGVAILGNVGGYLFAPIQQQFKYMCCFNSNITELETQLKKLETTKEGVQLRVDEDLRNVRIIAPDVKNWLERANGVTPEVEGIIQDKAKVKEGCLNGWCPNLKLRYSLSRKAVKKTKVVVDLKADGISYTKPSYRPRPACMETIPNGDFTGFESRRLVMEEIIKALKNDEINLIGVCGMGGVGKTTLVNEVAKRAKEDHFDEVAIAVVGQRPDLTHVQACIADTLGLEDLCNVESPIERANRLRKRLLLDNKKVLVILDDIWEEFDLQAMGIPLEGADKNFKMLYTSRTQNLWFIPRTKKEIPLELLSEDEAWKLFRDKAGDSADAKDLQPLAKQIANECGRLPLALVLIGSALSKKSGRNDIKEIWEDMLNRLICATSTPADGRLYSRLELSYQFLEDEEAKRLFLLCCLFQEDKDIRIEDLARYGLGLSLFEGINEMRKARCRVVALVYDLKSRYLLLNSKEEECVKVHDVVRDMGISIASKNKSALVIHGEVSEWPNKDTYEHYTFISLISTKITELPKGLTCPNLEFLLLDCRKLKELPSNFFEGMGKLKVLVLNNFKGILSLPSSLRNLQTLSLEGFHGMLDNVSIIGDLLNLEILSFCSSYIKELPEEIGKLVNLRLLDMRYTTPGRIPSGVISRLVCLEELYIMNGTFKDWEGEGEQEGRNANLREFESLSHLNTVEICIRAEVLIPKAPIFSKLEMYKVLIDNSGESETSSGDDQYKKQLEVSASTLFPSNHEEIYSLLRSSDYVRLSGKGCNDLVRELLLRDGVDGLQKLKRLTISVSDTPECLANTLNLVQQKPNVAAPDPVVFPILEKLNLYQLHNLGEICHGPVPAGSFGELTDIRVYGCGRLENLFQLPIVGCLTQLKKLIITHCDMMEEVIWKEQREDVHVTTNIIAFPKLELLELVNLPSLVGFCRGIDQIDFPQLKTLSLGSLEQVNRLFDNNSNLSSNLEQQNDDAAVLSLFPQKVTFPNLENLELGGLENVSDMLSSELPAFQFSKLKKLEVKGCASFKNLFHPSMAGVLVNLRTLKLINCWNMEAVVDWEVEIEDGRGREIEKTIFPQLMELQLRRLPKLSRFCHFTHPIELPQLSKVDILKCPIMDSISLGRVRAPSLSLPGISWNGDLNSAVQPLKEKRTKEEKRQKRLHDLFPDGTWGNLLHHALGTIQRGANDGDDMRHNNSARIRGGTDPQNSES